MKQILIRAAVACVALLPAGAAIAQNYPERQVRLVIPYPPGGGTDIIGRVVAQHLASNLGQQFIIDNRSGAGGTIGTEFVAKSPADGYSLLMVPTSHAINPSIYPKLSYDTLKQFTSITLAASATIVLGAHPSVPVKSVKELIAFAKARPGQLNFGSAGNGTVFHLTGELFKRQAGVDIIHVPFKGGGPVVQALAGGQITLAFETMLAMTSHMQAGRIRPLAVTSAKRSSVMPELPTVAELGFPDIIAENWYGFYAPAGTPAEIVSKLNAEIVKILKLPEVRKRFQELGTETMGSTPRELDDYLRKEMAKWSRTAKEAGARID
ncbi:MAG: tripartite tricarboxylate transporter substrate binding protein [Burkholderiales bacterium]|nr:tripartite tricarboxylate transporter substrate binding protein [Burkholderiales bacterium]